MLNLHLFWFFLVRRTLAQWTHVHICSGPPQSIQVLIKCGNIDSKYNETLGEQEQRIYLTRGYWRNPTGNQQKTSSNSPEPNCTISLYIFPNSIRRIFHILVREKGINSTKATSSGQVITVPLMQLHNSIQLGITGSTESRNSKLSGKPGTDRLLLDPLPDPTIAYGSPVNGLPITMLDSITCHCKYSYFSKDIPHIIKLAASANDSKEAILFTSNQHQKKKQ